MTQSIIITFNYPIFLKNLNVFQIGQNKSYFNKGKEDNLLKEKVLPAINNLTKIKTLKPINLFLSGRLLYWLSKHSNKTLNTLQTFVKKSNINLICSNYYNSSINTLTNEELHSQIKKSLDLIKKTLNKKTNTFISFDSQISTSQIKILKSNKLNKILLLPNQEEGNFSFKPSKNILTCSSKPTKNKNSILHLTQNYFLKNTNLDLETLPLHSLFSKNPCQPIAKRENPLKKHIKHELSNLLPLVNKMNDITLKEDWRMLTSNINILNNNSHKDYYENYISYMNILNDLCHKIKTVHLLQNRKEITKPILVNNPTNNLKEVLLKL